MPNYPSDNLYHKLNNFEDKLTGQISDYVEWLREHHLDAIDVHMSHGDVEGQEPGDIYVNSGESCQVQRTYSLESLVKNLLSLSDSGDEESLPKVANRLRSLADLIDKRTPQVTRK